MGFIFLRYFELSKKVIRSFIYSIEIDQVSRVTITFLCDKF